MTYHSHDLEFIHFFVCYLFHLSIEANYLWCLALTCQCSKSSSHSMFAGLPALVKQSPFQHLRGIFRGFVRWLVPIWQECLGDHRQLRLWLFQSSLGFRDPSLSTPTLVHYTSSKSQFSLVTTVLGLSFSQQ